MNTLRHERGEEAHSGWLVVWILAWLLALVLVLAPAAGHAQLETEIPAGIDCWDTECGQTRFNFCGVPLPADFFGPGSQPFEGEVYFQGKTGTHLDTQVERLGELFFPDVGSVAEVPIELVQLDLVSCDPITVQIGNEATEWDVSVELSDQRPQAGLLTAVKTHANGGTFESFLPVQPVFTFIRTDDRNQVRVLDTGQLGLPADLLQILDNVPWVHDLDDNSVGAEACSPFFAPGVREIQRGRNRGRQCCEVTCHAGATPTHCIEIGRDCSGCPKGACCFGKKGRCKVLKAKKSRTAAERCAAKNGVYHGDGSSCADTDGDRLADVREANNCCGVQTRCNLRSSPIFADTDGDGANDRVEFKKNTDACDPDSFP